MPSKHYAARFTGNPGAFYPSLTLCGREIRECSARRKQVLPEIRLEVGALQCEATLFCPELMVGDALLCRGTDSEIRCSGRYASGRHYVFAIWTRLGLAVRLYA
jgi:hypothetical protein